MSTGGLRVNHAGLDTAAQDLSRAVQQIDDRLNRLESELAPLRSDWTGNAQQAYQAAKTKWDAAMQDMKTLLADTSTTVTQSNQEYMAADQRGAASFDI
ncbi:WXG100 family type VII secretion target [Nocardioides pyridinolyticus]